MRSSASRRGGWLGDHEGTDMRLHRSGMAVAIVAGIGAMAAGMAMAHAPYLLPGSFAVTKDHVTLQGAMTEDAYFIPEFAIRAGDYLMTDPSGKEAKIAAVTQFKDLVVVEAPLPGDGTYKIGTGDRVGRTLKMAKIDGQWRVVRPANAPARQQAAAPAPGQMQGQMQGQAPGVPAQGQPRAIEASAVPPGAETAEVDTVLKAETYVTRGAPSPGALAVSGKGFELKPVTHPNEIFLDTGFALEMLADGKPIGDLKLTVYRGGNSYDEKTVFAETKTDARGQALLTFDRPGVYLVAARYPGRTPEGVKPAPRNYVYSLTFEVMP